MIRIAEIKLTLAQAESPESTEVALRAAACGILGLPPEALGDIHVFKRSFDARKAELMAVFIVDITLADPSQEAAVLQQLAGRPNVGMTPDMEWRAPLTPEAAAAWALDHPQAPRPVVVGFGPCGIFAALVLAQMGLRPIVLERGKAVRQRTKDTWGLWRKNLLQAESNVQFGEGGAGTFSDGKLYSQIKDPRHLGRKVMDEFVKAGAPEEILYAAHPHIGTFKLVKVVENLREQIIALGGEVRFQQRVIDFIIEGEGDNRHLRGLRVLDQSSGEVSGQVTELRADQVVLALGHSSRDTFEQLHTRGIFLESKPFSVGFRIEHPQGMIDRARWGRHAGHPLLGAADYKLVHHASNGRAVYSFCMCPGGTVVAATSETGRVVTNGMSQYSRNERNANAGIVVGIDPRDYPGDDPLAGMRLQRELESRAYVLGGSTYEAPGQLVGDFIAGRPSVEFGEVQPSYKPGVKLGDLHQALPAYAIEAMREALPLFGRKIAGFDRHDAVLTGVETRTSAPLRITRGDNYQSLNLRGLYPAGEGAGYAGGILSAGVDGIKVGEAVARERLAVAA
ncbi:MAG: FAD-dependent oxidoreductase [Ramlibacter sp.]|uniref:NAD(P)/FAD-dependent oxidoreductase n=1 Tax=Ramlibacter sp. TaxID=1917967 RepID=UPI00262B7E67|nr:FAD-dependent oxidoreductase [Ramlibacter sp.]MDH4376381.1 FAD-dependent oxidoreductase [Ramlibacter sp.]